MVEIDKPSAIFQLHVMLKEINPPIWRRILMRSDSSIADLHYIMGVYAQITQMFNRPPLPKN
jgi:hypothetical protein